MYLQLKQLGLKPSLFVCAEHICVFGAVQHDGSKECQSLILSSLIDLSVVFSQSLSHLVEGGGASLYCRENAG